MDSYFLRILLHFKFTISIKTTISIQLNQLSIHKSLIHANYHRWLINFTPMHLHIHNLYKLVDFSPPQCLHKEPEHHSHIIESIHIPFHVYWHFFIVRSTLKCEGRFHTDKRRHKRHQLCSFFCNPLHTYNMQCNAVSQLQNPRVRRH